MFNLQKNSSNKFKEQFLKHIADKVGRLVIKNDLSDSFNRDQVINDFNYFPRYVAKSYWKTAKHIEMLSDKLNAVERGEITRLIILAPPRHSKSQNVSTYFPAWYLGKHPDNRVILAAYGLDLAMDFSIAARDIIKEYGQELFGISLSRTKASGRSWDIDGRRGGLVAVGVGGATTGRGANCLPAGTMISTEHGYMDIAELSVMKNPPKAFSFNHKLDEIELKQIVASKNPRLKQSSQ